MRHFPAAVIYVIVIAIFDLVGFDYYFLGHRGSAFA